MAWSLKTIDDAEQTKERRGEISQENDNDDFGCQENLLHFLSVKTSLLSIDKIYIVQSVITSIIDNHKMNIILTCLHGSIKQ